MNRIITLTLLAACAAAICVDASAGSNVFTATGPNEASTCLRAENDANRWVQRNSLQFSLNHQQPSTSDCSCMGNDRDGWACQVTVSY